MSVQRADLYGQELKRRRRRRKRGKSWKEFAAGVSTRSMSSSFMAGLLYRLLLHNKSVNTFSPLANRRAHYNGAGIGCPYSPLSLSLSSCKCLRLEGIGCARVQHTYAWTVRIKLPFLGSFMNCFNAHLPVYLMGALPSYKHTHMIWGLRLGL